MKCSYSVWDVNTAIKPSKLLWRLALLAHVLAAIAIAVAVIPFFVKLIATALLIVSARYAYTRITLKNAQSIVHVVERTDYWQLTNLEGKSIDAELCTDVLVWRYLLILPFKTEYGRKYVVVLPDSVGGKTFRRMYVRMRFRHLPERDVLGVFKF